MTSGYNRFISHYAEWILRYRWAVIMVTLLAAIALAAGAPRLGFSTDYRVFFSKENPQLRAFEEIQNIYSKEDNILIVLVPDTGDVFTPDILQAAAGITEEGWQIPYTTRVDSVTNFQHTYAQGDDLTVEDLVKDAASLTPERIEQIRRIALAEPLLVNHLIASDGGAMGINVVLTLPGDSSGEVTQSIAAARKIVDTVQARYPDIEIAITGLAALNHAFTQASQGDLSFLFPLMYGVLLIVMVLWLRSFSGTLATLMVVGFASATAMGLAGWLDFMLSPPSASAPTIILTLAIADSIHFLSTMFDEMRRGKSREEAISESLRINFHPIFLTSLTTAIGFLSLNFSDAPPFRDLGNITTFGVIAAWIYAVSFLPAIMAVLPVRISATQTSQYRAMERIAGFVIARKRFLLIGISIVVIALAVMIPRITTDDRFVEYFDPSIQFRADSDFVMDHMAGLYQFHFSLESGQPGGVADPDFLKTVEAFSQWLRAQPDIRHVWTVSDVFKRLNKNMHGDTPSEYRLPESHDLAAQYLLLYEMSLPYGLDLNNQINVDKSSTRVMATLDNVTTSRMRELKSQSEQWLHDHLPGDATGLATGPSLMFAYIAERNIQSMLVGTGLALVLISFSLIIALRHATIGFLSLVPNLAPAAVTFGLWSIFVGEIGLASSVVAASTLGIVVDDTVHFLSKYLHARRVRHANPEDAVRYAFSTVGSALTGTSAILIMGFIVLSFSAFEINESLGLMSAITIAAALLVDFLLLPPLLMACDRQHAEDHKKPGVNA